jgi:hypothetical protein
LGGQVDDRAVFTAFSEGRADILLLLLNSGGSANARGYDVTKSSIEEETALWEAASCGHEEVVRNLLDNGADPDALSPNPKVSGPRRESNLNAPAFVGACGVATKPLWSCYCLEGTTLQGTFAWASQWQSAVTATG